VSIHERDSYEYRMTCYGVFSLRVSRDVDRRNHIAMKFLRVPRKSQWQSGS
jgi:hypothetical protein